MRPGIRRRCSSRAAKKPNDGPPKSRRLPSVWPSPTQTSTPRRRAARGSRARSGRRCRRRARRARAPPRSAARGPRRRRGSSAARRTPRRRRRRSPPPSAAASVTPSRSPTSVDGRAVAGRERLQRLARMRVHAARDDEARAAVGQLREVAGGRERRGPLVDRGVGDVHPGQLADRRLELEHHLQAALRDLRLVGRVRASGTPSARAACRRPPARSGRTCPPPRKRDLVLGRAVARGQLAQVRVDLRLAEPVGQLERAPEAQRRRDLGEQLLDAWRRRSPRASPRGRRR